MPILLELASYGVADLAALHFFGVGGLEVAGALELYILAHAAEGRRLHPIAQLRRILTTRRQAPIEQ